LLFFAENAEGNRSTEVKKKYFAFILELLLDPHERYDIVR